MPTLRWMIAMLLCAVPCTRAATSDSLTQREWTIDGVKREAMVYVPKDHHLPMPVVFVFHGHGGNMNQVARSFRIHELWPEAIVIYPQGLKTPGRLTDPDGNRPGWQSGQGEQGDRDLKFFDAMLKTVRKEQKVDDERIYVTGHSNGGTFTYVLMAARHDELAAVAPSGSLDRDDIKSFKPLPVFHSAGAEDPLVKFEWQQKMIQFLLSLNHCESNGMKDGNLTTYKSDIGMPVVTYIYNGGHKFPPEVPPEIVKFFKSQKRATTQPSRD